MGWCSGSDVAQPIVDSIQENVKSPEIRRKLYKAVINALENHDWDCQDDLMGQDVEFDAVLRELHPDWYEDTSESEFPE